MNSEMPSDRAVVTSRARRWLASPVRWWSSRVTNATSARSGVGESFVAADCDDLVAVDDHERLPVVVVDVGEPLDLRRRSGAGAR